MNQTTAQALIIPTYRAYIGREVTLREEPAAVVGIDNTKVEIVPNESEAPSLTCKWRECIIICDHIGGDFDRIESVRLTRHIDGFRL